MSLYFSLELKSLNLLLSQIVFSLCGPSLPFFFFLWHLLMVPFFGCVCLSWDLVCVSWAALAGSSMVLASCSLQVFSLMSSANLFFYVLIAFPLACDSFSPHMFFFFCLESPFSTFSFNFRRTILSCYFFLLFPFCLLVCMLVSDSPLAFFFLSPFWSPYRLPVSWCFSPLISFDGASVSSSFLFHKHIAYPCIGIAGLAVPCWTFALALYLLLFFFLPYVSQPPFLQLIISFLLPLLFSFLDRSVSCIGFLILFGHLLFYSPSFLFVVF